MTLQAKKILVINLREEIAGLNTVIEQSNMEEMTYSLNPIDRPANKPNGSWFTITIDGFEYTNVRVQVYGHVGAERHVAWLFDGTGCDWNCWR